MSGLRQGGEIGRDPREVKRKVGVVGMEMGIAGAWLLFMAASMALGWLDEDKNGMLMGMGI
jgi:hypothetical protein